MMMRSTMAFRPRWQHGIATAVLAILTAGWGFSEDAPTKPVPARGTLSERSLPAALTEHVNLQFSGVPLDQVIRTLRERHGLTVNVDRGGQAANINVKQLVTCDLVGLRLQSALDRLLSGLELDWIVTSDGLLITTPARAASLLEIRIYNIADLSGGAAIGCAPGGGYYAPSTAAYNTFKPPTGKVAQLSNPENRVVPDPDEIPAFNRPPSDPRPHPTPTFDRGYDSVPSQRQPNPPSFEDRPASSPAPSQLMQPGGRQVAGISLIEIIETSVNANWKSSPAGQPIRLLNDNPNLLVIRQPQRVHREIENLLSRLRTEIKQPAGQTSDELVTVAYPIGRQENWLSQLMRAAAMSQPGNVTVDVQKLAGAKPEQTELTGEKLAEALTDLVRPESWKKNGGRGDLRGLPGVILVRQTADVHALVQQSLLPLSPFGGASPAYAVPYSAGRASE